MSKDIHKWTDGRYTLMFDEHTFFVWDNEKDDRMTALETTKRLNEQQATISALRTENNHLIDVIKEYAKKYEEQQATIEELRLQEKEKGVPVFVVRDGKNLIALFFNEQRASLYCQENMANLTYQQEKWCRVE